MMIYLKKIFLFISFFTFLYPQWAMWSNPSLPVGGSDTGIGLGAGEIMIFGNFGYQYFDWWHDKIPGAIATNNLEEDFEHNGLFKNKLIDLGFMIGLNDYWNITISQLISIYNSF